ncbi:ficolin-3-like [Mya arenaria]|uniref:ficolin-3-like n=1 Tax=Mya arenaria TaxID=6604 RepID=UPI0022E1913D|nr:ficolin-3-like [Mya arenaria]
MVTGICTLTVKSEYEIPVYFDTGTDGGGWIVIQRRINGSTDFYRGWEEYKAGFGNLMGEFWLGNEYIHQLTASGNRELRVELEDEDGQKAFAHYSHFQVLSEEKGYQLNVSGYTGTAGDSLSYHDGMKFSTFDKDNDLRKGNCAIDYEGAWWYKSCVNSNLNGKYGRPTGAAWYFFNNIWEPMKRVEIKIR